MLVLTGFPSDRPPLVDLCANFTKQLSLMICGHVIIVGILTYCVLKDCDVTNRAVFVSNLEFGRQ